ncbi:DENN domain-containing protein 1A [Trichonephila inaurata madagascariensis]|uniref:DENN domain-containing protein 1A n=1 Tax=Trichonephila inaurata madagascariensis TaxID=2747483 RepID=A0A8X6JRD3_9ARAC|nr:DENN domain-containing protein 1A [Trichonephila inaurata madagascariensis]
MGSRIRENPTHVFECFFEVVIPSENEKNAWILQKYPEDFDDKEVLKSVPEFSCPCEFNNTAIQHFSFVLTNLDSKWSFGYCRHAPNTPTLIVLLSHLPWHETFYKILNQIADLTNAKETSVLTMFLESLYNSSVPDPGLNLHVQYNEKEFIVYCPNHLKLPSIPENRNLTEYFNAIDAQNMMIIFSSMLHERRILVTSKKLSRLSACVQAANSLIYPMHWQHIFIPVLPKHLIDYLSAPMPFLIGVPAVTMEKIRQSELNEVVILDADNNRVKTPFNDLETLPPEIVASLKRSLKNPNMMLGDGVSRAFMTALVKLIGGYRDSLKFTLGEKISFDSDAFILSRPPSVQPFLETMLHLQIFQQFIENRLDMLNSGVGFSDEFEYEVNTYEVHSSNNLRTQYKEWVTTMKKEGGAFFKNVKSKTNPAVKHAYKSVKDKGKRAYKDFRSKIQDIQKHPSQPDLRFDSFEKPKSAPSSPTTLRSNRFPNSKRISYNHSIDTTKSAVLDSINLPNSISGIRRYKMLTVDEISLPSEESNDDRSSPSLQRIDIDLMEDLRDVIYRRCSVSSDNINSFGLTDECIEDITSDGMLGFTDSFCVTSEALPAPIPPPRSKRNVKSSKTNIPSSTKPSTESSQNNLMDEPLIQLESLDDVALFDPLRESNANDTNLLSFLAPKSTSDSKVTELKNTIQNLTSTPSHQMNSQPMGFYPTTSFCVPRVAQPGLVMPRYPVVPSVSPVAPQSNGFGNFENPVSEVKPALPPKTRPPSSTFFVSTNELSDMEKNLLDDYGLSSSPLFKKSVDESSRPPDVPEKTKLSSPLDLLGNVKKSPRQKQKVLRTQPTWQKFT